MGNPIEKGGVNVSIKNHIALVHASEAQLEPKWNQKVSKSLQNGAKSRLKRYPKIPFSVQKCRHAVRPINYLQYIKQVGHLQ